MHALFMVSVNWLFGSWAVWRRRRHEGYTVTFIYQVCVVIYLSSRIITISISISYTIMSCMLENSFKMLVVIGTSIEILTGILCLLIPDTLFQKMY